MSSEGGKIGGKTGGPASIKKRKESPPRDAKYKMADGSAPENDHQQMSSEGGNARSNNNQQRLKGEQKGKHRIIDDSMFIFSFRTVDYGSL